MFQSTDLLFHLAPALGMLGVVILNQLVAQGSLRRRGTAEKWRLAAALLAELRGLQELLEDNLTLIMQDADRLLSARNLLAVYKANIGRLATLVDEAPLSLVVAAYGTVERIEAHVAASTTPNGGFAYKVDPKRTEVQALKRLFARGSDDIAAAMAALEQLTIRPRRGGYETSRRALSAVESVPSSR